MDGGLSQGGGAQTGRAGLAPAPSSSSHPSRQQPHLRAVPGCRLDTFAWPSHRQFKSTWSHRALDLLPGIHLAALPRPSRLPSHPKREPSFVPRPPISPSSALLVLFPQNVSDIPLHLCYLHSCHLVLELPSPPSSLDGPLACPLRPFPIHPEGSSLAPRPFRSQRGTLAEFSAQQPGELRTESVPAHSVRATPPAPFLRSARPALPHAHPIRQPRLCSSHIRISPESDHCRPLCCCHPAWSLSHADCISF